ncbi:MAG: hypothetical protein ACOH1O_14435 [Flavobacterium sp.]
MNAFIEIYTTSNKTVYLNITQITKVEAGNGCTKISLSNTDLIETNQKLEDVLKLLPIF